MRLPQRSSLKMRSMEEKTVKALYGLVAGRRENPRKGSYTSLLFENGRDTILKKVGEEAIEVIIAAKNEGRAKLVNELADLAYHLIVMMVEEGIALEEISLELERRMRQ